MEKLFFPESIDSTMLSCFISCPQKFFVEFILRKVPMGRSIHLHAGGCFALALETVRRKVFGERKSLQDALEDAFLEFTLAWGMFDSAPDSKNYKDFTNMWCAVEAYFKEYPPLHDYFQPYMLANGQPAVEFKFALPMDVRHPVTGDPVLYSGRSDMLCQPTGESGLYVDDEKTTKNLGESWYKQWDMRGQFFGYTYVGKQTGFNVVGSLVRGIAIQQTQFSFAEKPIFYTKDQLSHWWRNANRQVDRMVGMWKLANEQWEQGNRRAMHDEFLYSYGEACTSFGQCQFTPLCLSSAPWALYEDFETRIWNPLAKDPTAESEDRLSKMEKMSWADAMRGM